MSHQYYMLCDIRTLFTMNPCYFPLLQLQLSQATAKCYCIFGEPLNRSKEPRGSEDKQNTKSWFHKTLVGK